MNDSHPSDFVVVIAYIVGCLLLVAVYTYTMILVLFGVKKQNNEKAYRYNF